MSIIPSAMSCDEQDLETSGWDYCVLSITAFTQWELLKVTNGRQPKHFKMTVSGCFSSPIFPPVMHAGLELCASDRKVVGSMLLSH